MMAMVSPISILELIKSFEVPCPERTTLPSVKTVLPWSLTLLATIHVFVSLTIQSEIGSTITSLPYWFVKVELPKYEL